ncbi:DNA-processing protein DprA [Polaribacter pectinis]|uniref:DNA-processing protein DprA n=1 Tax=Polaribacter pectinis TaxID=2738844 RepID=A0A7G9L7I8_9FLAO|nr:DNA-processing protein DprA [Polaribacter pectinis]QNM84587.1 DNA-processing protein DprA [Polaribacter pectinis]
MNIKIKHILAISLIKGVGDAFIKKRLNEIKLYINDIDLLGNMLGGKVTKEGIIENFPIAEKIIEDCIEGNIELVSLLCDSYPCLLKEIKNPPAILYLKGNITNLSNCVAVIGSRKSDDLGNAIANKVGNYFSQKWSICNGLVDGIDRNAIEQNDSVFKNVTGVISGGLNYHRTSSKITKELADKVLRNNGLLISENPPNKAEDQFSGSKASRIQAGLSKGIILIQSSIAGGSKYTLKSFSELDRVLGVINYPGNKSFETEEQFSGNRLLLEKGIEGLVEMCDIKKNSNVKIDKIVQLKSKEDYSFYDKQLVN